MTIAKIVFDGEVHVDEYGKRAGKKVELTPAELILWEKKEKESIDEQVELAKTKYQRDRATEYPPMSDQLDMLWHAMDTGILPKVDSFYDINKSIKDKYPKE